MACYVGLLRFAKGKANGSELEGRSFYISAIAGAMFLVLSIAGADLLVALGLLCSHWDQLWDQEWDRLWRELGEYHPLDELWYIPRN